jgi:WD40 repeat protein
VTQLSAWQCIGLQLIYHTVICEASTSTGSKYGTRIASGSYDHTIIIWNAHNGARIAGPFEGHTDYVNSVAFSSDGTRIVSGSDDCTILVWKADDGTRIAGPLVGHVGGVRSVTFSPDSTHMPLAPMTALSISGTCTTAPPLMP